MSHTEGGWPRDVNPADAEQKSRYRKKLEKDEDFLLKTRHLVRETERFVRQNNCIDIFEDYFEAADPATDLQPASVSSVAVYKDPLEAAGGQRSINKVCRLYCTLLYCTVLYCIVLYKVCWAPGGETIALAYCNTEYLAYHDRRIDTRCDTVIVMIVMMMMMMIMMMIMIMIMPQVPGV